MKYYCLHHSPAKDRKEFLLPIFKRQNIEVEWIENFLPNCKEIVNYPKVYNKYSANSEYLNNAELSLIMKHILAIKKIASINDYGIIFEDDIDHIHFVLRDIVPIFINLMEQIHGDILWIGSIPHRDLSGYPLYKKDITVYSNKETKDRCSHCYMIHSKIANKILDFYSNIKAPSDWQWNLTIDHFKLKSCWSFPHIYQRSAFKLVPSLIRET